MSDEALLKDPDEDKNPKKESKKESKKGSKKKFQSKKSNADYEINININGEKKKIKFKKGVCEINDPVVADYMIASKKLYTPLA